MKTTLVNDVLTLVPLISMSHNRGDARNSRTFGYAVDIQQGKCDNKDAPFNFTVATRLLFTSDGGSSGFVWARVQAFSSNFVTLSGAATVE